GGRIEEAGVGEVVEAGRLGLLADEPQALDVAVEDDHVADAAGKAHGSGAPARSEEEHPRARLQVQEELPAGARRVDEILERVLPRRPGELRPEACKPRLLGRAQRPGEHLGREAMAGHLPAHRVGVGGETSHAIARERPARDVHREGRAEEVDAVTQRIAQRTRRATNGRLPYRERTPADGARERLGAARQWILQRQGCTPSFPSTGLARSRTWRRRGSWSQQPWTLRRALRDTRRPA